MALVFQYSSAGLLALFDRIEQFPSKDQTPLSIVQTRESRYKDYVRRTAFLSPNTTRKYDRPIESARIYIESASPVAADIKGGPRTRDRLLRGGSILSAA